MYRKKSGVQGKNMYDTHRMMMMVLIKLVYDLPVRLEKPHVSYFKSRHLGLGQHLDCSVVYTK